MNVITVVICVTLLFIYIDRSTSAITPNYQGCLTPLSQSFPYCNYSLPLSTRVTDLITRLSLTEKISLMVPADGTSSCNTYIAGNDRLGIPPYMWLVETNSGAGSDCMKQDKCATSFVSVPGLAASFNSSLWHSVGIAISSEFRAISNSGGQRPFIPSNFYQIGVTGFGPNINIIHDPRFGRASELPGEDPFLTGRYAVELLQGMMEEDQNQHPRMMSMIKHFNVYSAETNRLQQNAIVSAYDLWDSYMPPFQMAMTQGRAAGVMCSYSAINGVPSCANSYLLNTVLRDQFNRSDAVVMTDCGAVSHMSGPPLNVPTPDAVSAYTVGNGTDIEAGDVIWRGGLLTAVTNGLLSESTIDQSLFRSLSLQFKAGRFDPISDIGWSSLTLDSSVNTTLHQQINYEAALQSFVLLKNFNNILPLRKDKKIAVIGPGAVTRRGLLPSYFGEFLCYDPLQTRSNRTYSCIPTIGEAILSRNTNGVTLISRGVDIDSTDTSGIADAVQSASVADIVVLVLGLDTITVELERVDREVLTLPGLQLNFAAQIFQLNKPIVLVLLNGGAVAIDSLISESSAIIEAFYPGTQGATALAASLFGDENRFGRLPMTIYSESFINEIPSITSYDMRMRTYRYYNGRPLYPFGMGLSYTNFKLNVNSVVNDDSLIYMLNVTNIGNRLGDCVVTIYHSLSDAIRNQIQDIHPVPITSLVSFSRFSDIQTSFTSHSMCLTVDTKLLTVTDESGNQTLYDGDHMLTFSIGDPDTPSTVVTVTVNQGKILVPPYITSQFVGLEESCTGLKGKHH